MSKREISTAETIAGLLLMPPGFVLEGWVLKTMWAWFVVPTFGLPALTLPVAIGLPLLVNMVVNTAKPKYDDSSALEIVLGVYYVAPLFGLAFGWVVHQFC